MYRYKAARSMSPEQLEWIVSEVAEMTNQNDHTGALVLIVDEMVSHKKLREAVYAVKALAEYYGDVSGGLSDIHRDLYNEVLAYIKNTYGDDVHDTIYQSL